MVLKALIPFPCLWILYILPCLNDPSVWCWVRQETTFPLPSLRHRDGGAECWDICSSVCPAKLWLPWSLVCPLVSDVLCVTLAVHYHQKHWWGKSANLVPMVGPCCLFFGFSNLSFSPMESNSGMELAAPSCKLGIPTPNTSWLGSYFFFSDLS